MARQLSSLRELAAVFAENGAKAVRQAELGLGEAARLIRDEARARVDGWAAEAGESSALRDSIVVEQEGNAVVVGSVLEIAAEEEFGTALTPPRPFLGPAVVASQDEIACLTGERFLGAM